MRIQTPESYCFCLTRKYVAIFAAGVTLLKIIAQIAYESITYQNLLNPASADYANFWVFILGQVFQLAVTILLFYALNKENPDMMWPYLCWLSLNVLLEGFGCLILVYTNSGISAIMNKFVVYCISLLMSISLIYFVNTYEKELRRREVNMQETTTSLSTEQTEPS